MPDIATGWIVVLLVAQWILGFGVALMQFRQQQIEARDAMTPVHVPSLDDLRHTERRIRAAWVGYTGGVCPHCGEPFGIEGTHEESTSQGGE